MTTVRRVEKEASRRDRFVWFLLFLAIAERLAFQLGSRDRGWPFTIFYEGDAEAFFHYAQAILLGGRYDNGIPFHPPFFPLVLAGLHGILGNPVPQGLLRAILAIASGIVPVLLYIFVRDSIGRPVAILVGLLAAFSFGLDILGCSATSEGLFLILLLLLLLAMRAPPGVGRRGFVRGLLLGLLGGALALTRAEGIALVFLLGLIWLSDRDRRKVRGRLAATAGLLAGLVLVLSPWTVRNSIRLAEWNREAGSKFGVSLPTLVPITAYGPLNFALANNDKATGAFQRELLTSRSDQAVLDLADPQHAHYFLHGVSEGMRWITAHPDRFLSLVARKLSIAHRALDLGWTPWNLPHGRTGTRRAVDLFAPDRGGIRWIQLTLAALGMILLFRQPGRRKIGLLLCAPMVGVALATVLFFGYVRLGLLAAPFLFVFEAIALVAAWERLPLSVRVACSRRVVRYGLFGLALLLLVIAGLEDRNYNASGSTDRPGGKLQRDVPIRIEPID